VIPFVVYRCIGSGDGKFGDCSRSVAVSRSSLSISTACVMPARGPGHSKGDLAIQAVAFEVRRALPKDGRVYKLMSAEFRVLLPDMNGQQASSWAETVRKAVAADVKVVDSKQGSRPLTVRAAVTEHIPTRRLWSMKDQTPLIMATQDALVEARSRGGNCVVTRPAGAVLESLR
jgi:PleD family two-component response regulator